MSPRGLIVVLLAIAASAIAAKPGWLGMGVRMPETSGRRFVFVQHVLPGSPADRAGIREQDLIVDIDGKPVGFPNREAMVAFFRAVKVSQKLRLTVVRGTRELKVVVQATEAPPRYAPLLR